LACEHAKDGPGLDFCLRHQQKAASEAGRDTRGRGRDSNPGLVKVIFDERNVLKTEDAKRAKQNSVDANVIVAEVKDQTNDDRQSFDGHENRGQRFKSVRNQMKHFELEQTNYQAILPTLKPSCLMRTIP
jgi:hypothetical protein